MLNSVWRVCVGMFACALGLGTAKAATGDWDTSYASGGRLPLTVAGYSFDVQDWQAMPDGRIVIIGQLNDEPSGFPFGDHLIARLNPDGTPDTSFDGDGVMLIDQPDFGMRGLEFAVLGDGRLLLSLPGYNPLNQFDRVRVTRLNVDGSLDTTFGTGGNLFIFDPRWVQNPHLAMAPDGSAIVAARLGDWMTNPSILVAKITSAGTPDPAFGVGGRVVIDAPVGNLEAYVVRVQGDGRVVLGGILGTLNNWVPFVTRLTSTGQLDTTFGIGGFSILSFLDGQGYVADVAPTANGKIFVAAQQADRAGVDQHYIARLNADGTPDVGFGSGGRNMLGAGTSIASLLAESDGKVLAAGRTTDLGMGSALLARYNSDGSPDVTFGLRGRSQTDFSEGASPILAGLKRLRRDADGAYRALVSGGQIGPAYGLARFAAGGTHPGSIGIRSSYETNGDGIARFPEMDYAWPLVLYRSGGTDGAVSVQYRIVGQTATAGQDFVGDTATVTFNEGEVRKVIYLQTLDDAILDSGETFYVELFAPTGGAQLSRSRMNGLFYNDNDIASVIGFTTTIVYSVENSGSARLLVQRTGEMSQPVTVSYALTASGATAGTDYNGSPGTVSWAANEGGIRVVDIPLLDDAIVETNEGVVVTLSSSTSDVTISPQGRTASVVIVDDDDTAATPSIGFKTSMVTVTEGVPVVTLEVQRFGNVSQALSATWNTTQTTQNVTATAGQDFTHANGVLNWAAGDATPKTFTVPILDDSAAERPEAFFVNIFPAASADSRNGGYAQVLILDNEPADAQPTISITPSTSFAESVGVAMLTLSLSSVPAIDVSVNYTFEYGTATSGDIVVASGTSRWNAGDASPKQIGINITNDARDEVDETFSVSLSGAQGARIGAASVQYTIVDDDPTPAGQSGPVAQGLQVQSSISVGEGERFVRLRVSRVGDTGGQLIASGVVASGTASWPDDFASTFASLSWADGEGGEKQLDIQLNGDQQAEPNETFTVRFMPRINFVPLAEVSTMVTIVDDDAGGGVPATVEFMSATQSVSENATLVTLQVARSGNTSIASSVDFTTVAGTATTADFTAATGTLTWGANDTSIKLITITLTPDSSDEPDESFSVTLRNPSAGTQLGTASATVTIVDDDGAQSGNRPSSGRGGGGEESLIALLLWAMLVRLRRRAMIRR